MLNPFRVLIYSACLSAATTAAHADWRPQERIEHYQVRGTTGIELYQSIGANGPRIGAGNVIAYTDFRLIWSRDYRPQPDGSCKLVTARPNLTITYRLPKASGSMPAATKELWDRFIKGVTVHERVHGDIIVDMVREIEKVSVGLSAPNDPDCKKVRAALQAKLGPISERQRARSRDFDRVEMSNGGNVHRLVLDLVNGDG